METAGYAANIPPNAWHEFASKMPFLFSIGNPGTHTILDSNGLSSLHVAVGGRLWYTLSSSPTSTSHTRFTCNVYLNWPGDNAQADTAVQAIKDEVCSILSGAKAAPLTLDATAAGLQVGILDELTAHLKEERKRSKKVWPASRDSTVSEMYNQADLRKSHRLFLSARGTVRDDRLLSCIRRFFLSSFPLLG